MDGDGEESRWLLFGNLSYRSVLLIFYLEINLYDGKVKGWAG
jgi:hypothetical protein